MHECVVVCASVVCSRFLTCPISVLSVYNACVAYSPASYDRRDTCWPGFHRQWSVRVAESWKRTIVQFVVVRSAVKEDVRIEQLNMSS